MTTHILYNKITGQIRHVMPGNHGAAFLASVLASTPDKENYAEAEVDEEAVAAIPNSTSHGKVCWRLLRYVDGAVSVLPEVVAEVATKDARRAAKQAAKADAKMAQLAGMTQKEFLDLTIGDRWVLVFAFMKAHLEEG